jgi:methionine synthase I (cobalamin-dependent)
LTYDNFISLYYGLYRIKQIQGYGCLYRLDDDIDLEELELQYDEYVDGLKQKESPVVAYETPQDLLQDTKYTLISRKSFFKYLRIIL